MTAQILITYNKKSFIPAVASGIKWSLKRRSTPGKLTFTIIDDKKFEIGEGAAINFQYNKQKIFFGFIFSLQRKKDGTIDVVAYDQLRYLKNKDTIVYSGKTAAELVTSIAQSYMLQTGDIEDTKYVIPSRVEENTTLFDIIEDALDDTLTNTKQMFVLFDDFGKLALRNISSMYVKDEDEKYLLIDDTAAEDYSYKSSIDDKTYNKIKLTYDNEDRGVREVYIAQDSESMNNWGVLQYFETLKEGENGQVKADALLNLYDRTTRQLKITKAFGDVRVRAGSMVLVKLNLGDVSLSNFLMVEEVTHTFEESFHSMDLTLRGGVITG